MIDKTEGLLKVFPLCVQVSIMIITTVRYNLKAKAQQNGDGENKPRHNKSYIEQTRN